MDIAFEILIPVENIITTIEFQQPKFEWDGEFYPQGQEEGFFYFFKLIKSEPPEHVLRMLPDSLFDTTWQCISILEGLDVISNSLLIPHAEDKSSKLLELLSILLKDIDKWVVVFEPDYDRIDEIGRGDINTVFSKIKSSLTLEKKGFINWYIN